MSIIYVDLNATGADDGTSWADAYDSLQGALSAASSGDEIWVAVGTYTPTSEVGGVGDAYKTFQLKNGVEIYGGFDATETSRSERNWIDNVCTVSGELGATDSYHVFYHPAAAGLDATAILDGFTIRGGYADGVGDDGKGGGMFNAECDPTIRNCKIIANYAATSGAGLYIDDASPTFINCLIGSNTADGGYAGICSTNESDSSFYGCEISDNTGPDAGGIGNDLSSNITLINCTIAGNTATSSGSESAGGIFNGDDSVAAQYPRAVLYNCVIWGNTANGSGYDEINALDTLTDTVTNLVLTNCIYQDETGDAYLGTDSVETNILNENPAYTDSANSDYSVGLGSPCLDTGDNDLVPAALTVDLNNAYRKSGGVVDIGAYEYQWQVSLNYTAGANGSLTGDTAQTINYNGSGTAVTAVPAAGYSFGAWSDGNTDNPRTDTSVAIDVDVEAVFAGDGITCDELHDSRDFTVDKGATLLYIVEGTDDLGSAVDKVKATSPAEFEGLYRNDISVSPMFVDTVNETKIKWRVTVQYSPRDISAKETGDSTFQFDTTGGTQHVDVGIKTVSTLGDFEPEMRGINDDGKSVAGVDITSPQYRWSETHYIARSKITLAYTVKLFWMTGRVNNASFKGFAAGEVLFLGANGAKRGNGDWEITFSFAGSPNRKGIVIEGLDGSIDKKGWDYLWVRYQKADGDKGMYMKPVQANVEQVYETYDFSILGIGT